MRQLGIILQLTDKGYCKDKGFANDIDVGQLSISKVKWDDEAIYNNGTEGDDSASYDKALCNNQLDEAWDGTRGIIMPRIGQQSLTQQSLDEEEGYCEAE